MELNLASLVSVRRCASQLLEQSQPFDVVITNAGIMATPFTLTENGFESQLATNHLGHFVLVNRLVPLLRPGARVVSLASLGHQYADVDLEDPNFERSTYDPFIAYARSKTANILFAVELDRRHRQRGVRATAVHPGAINTPLGRHLPDQSFMGMVAQVNETLTAQGKPLFTPKTLPQGAATSVWAGVVAPVDEVGGLYSIVWTVMRSRSLLMSISIPLQRGCGHTRCIQRERQHCGLRPSTGWANNSECMGVKS